MAAVDVAGRQADLVLVAVEALLQWVLATLQSCFSALASASCALTLTFQSRPQQRSKVMFMNLCMIM